MRIGLRVQGVVPLRLLLPPRKESEGAAQVAHHHPLLRIGASGFRVQGSGFRVQGSGFRVQGSGFKIQSSGFKVGFGV